VSRATPTVQIVPTICFVSGFC